MLNVRWPRVRAAAALRLSASAAFRVSGVDETTEPASRRRGKLSWFCDSVGGWRYSCPVGRWRVSSSGEGEVTSGYTSTLSESS